MVASWQRNYVNTIYKTVEIVGGPGDKGRDVLCTCPNNDLVIYQCKNYSFKLDKNDVLPEIAKCCYYSYNRSYSVPILYCFVSPHGVTPNTRDMMANPAVLKAETKLRWSKVCKPKVHVELEGALSDYIENYNFSVFKSLAPDEFLEWFRKTPSYAAYFPALAKPRPRIEAYPENVATNELVYIRKILDAYGEYLDKNIDSQDTLKRTDPQLWDDFNRHRFYFYSAEYLAAYSREINPPDSHWFEELKLQFYHGIIYVVKEDAENGYVRLRKVLERSTLLQISSDNQASSTIKPEDRMGICHHLANERGEITWKQSR